MAKTGAANGPGPSSQPVQLPDPAVVVRADPSLAVDLDLQLDPSLSALVQLTPRLPRSLFGQTLSLAPAPSAPEPIRPLRLFGTETTYRVSEQDRTLNVLETVPFVSNLSATFRDFHFRGTSFSGFGAGLAFGSFDGRLGFGVMGLIPGLGSGILSIKLGRED